MPELKLWNLYKVELPLSQFYLREHGYFAGLARRSNTDAKWAESKVAREIYRKDARDLAALSRFYWESYQSELKWEARTC